MMKHLRFWQTKTPLLLTPGPLTTAAAVREPMRFDYPSRDESFITDTQNIITALQQMTDAQDSTAIALLSGSGSYAVEAMLRSTTDQTSSVLIIDNGAYGERLVSIAKQAQIAHIQQKHDPHRPLALKRIETALQKHPHISHIAMTHCETSSGMLNAYDAVFSMARCYDKRLLLDAMSTFGAYPLNMPKGSDTGRLAIAASANKCLEGTPGLAFVIADTSMLVDTPTSFCFDLRAQAAFMRQTGQFRFTPPVQVVQAFAIALQRHAREGGCIARRRRYATNQQVLVTGMRQLGFQTVLKDSLLSPIIVSFAIDSQFPFQSFYHRLKQAGFIIYDGKIRDTTSFRVGCIGNVFPKDMRRFLQAVRRVLKTL